MDVMKKQLALISKNVPEGRHAMIVVYGAAVLLDIKLI